MALARRPLQSIRNFPPARAPVIIGGAAAAGRAAQGLYSMGKRAYDAYMSSDGSSNAAGAGKRFRQMKTNVTPTLSRTQEMKFFDINIDNNLSTTLGVAPNGHDVHAYLCAGGAPGSSGIAIGTSASQRIGRKIFLKSLTINMTYHLNTIPGSSIADTEWSFRWILAIDTQSNGVMPILADLLQYDGTLSDAYNSPYNLNTAGRFRVLKDKKFSLPHTYVQRDTTDVELLQTSKRDVKFYKKFSKPLSIEYNGSTGTASELTRNNVVCFVIPYFVAAATANHINEHGYVRLRYHG